MPRIPDGTTIGNKYRVINMLGSGDAGTVYRVRQLGIDVDRALKILDPKLPGVPRETFAREFTAETQKLSQLTHRHLVKLIDAGNHDSDGESFPYYVTDLVRPRTGEESALTLGRWAREVHSRDDFVDILVQLTEGLSYLHTHGCLHCDIKPNNILLAPGNGDKYELKIADLGSSKILLNVQQPDTQRTHVVGTVDYAPDYVLSVINTDQTVSLSELRAWFPHWDLFCVGSTLARIIWVESTRGDRDFRKMLRNPRINIESAFGRDFDVLTRIILRLVDPVITNCFPTVSSLAEAFRKFLPEYLVPLGVREMAVGGAHRALTQPREKVYLSDRAYKLVEHPVFQRLHNLNQLNFVYMLYSGAKHSRFLHSLSTYEMAKRYIEGLLGNSYFKYLMYKGDFELFLVGALLHDIGQYPLAHAIEDLGDEDFTGVKSGAKTDFQMFHTFLGLKDKRGKTLADQLDADWRIDVERLVRILSRAPGCTETDYFIRSMLDGPIDVDKVSYLIYDSYFTGAQYGMGIDLDSFLSGLVAIPPDDGARHAQIGILDGGVVAAEGVIAARYSMFSRVYWHHFNRSIMAMLKYAASRLFLAPDACSFEQYISDTLECSDRDAVRYLRDRLGSFMTLEKGNPLDGLLDGTRNVHRRLLTFQGGSGSATGPIHRLLTSCPLRGLEELRRTVIDKLETVLGDRPADYEVLFDVPKVEKRRDVLGDLYVYNPEARGENYTLLSGLSGVTKALCDEFEELTKKSRIFVSSRIREMLEANAAVAQRARDEVEDFLRAEANRKGC